MHIALHQNNNKAGDDQKALAFEGERRGSTKGQESVRRVPFTVTMANL
jgi:hypothetical protein